MPGSLELDDDEKGALVDLLRETIERDRFPALHRRVAVVAPFRTLGRPGAASDVPDQGVNGTCELG